MSMVTSSTAGTGPGARIAAFLAREDGAVTVDWVVLTAAIVGVCIGMFTSVNAGLYKMGETVGEGLSEAQVTRLDTVLK
ncbi:hypothetical protein [Rhodovulum steppense]|uniref:Flp pilus assembly pilin Flp n=1 Tax=Rhodovulum steppense TaxID=540251 RepID=A0A4R1YUN9_9RHOB|nr:hypothetical protein [Rhodovulum steppense]TCM84577.1 hypothetical protein EV216_11158 [Rhodovulum steppense]